ncbi:peroxidasin isoform X1 [Tribolium castaneum]|uniref:Peroxidasin n=2 Tax=Tribolium castaneum TaxID=7070 RepID=D6WFS4_TRICA|nr:PREDICTED: peroxidasin isoform X1 [Tribolium castaneum]EFA01243.1 peroxidasin [Tribolium castaneum]|eukprot:XP_968570.1 PREDICTED: peroxidasin isoform X1 [Tribolium castaneum]
MWRLCLIFLTLGLTIIDAQRRNYSQFPCPSRCVCFRRTVRCMQLELTEVPKAPLPTVMLDLRFNKIRDIVPGSFKGHKALRSLLLNNNSLKSLKNGIFTGLVQLRHLYLYKNRIKYIEDEVFHGLPKLEHLYLHNNELEEFKSGTFSNIPQLDRLFLYNNHISHIPAGAFQNLPKLTRLRLDQNALVCDCRIAWFAKMLNDNTIHVAANCRYPHEMYGKPLKGMTTRDFHCKAPEIMEGPQDVEISWGSTAVFTCRVTGDPKPSIYWMRDDKEIEMNNDKYDIMDNGSLVIKHTDESDSGHYECMAKNEDGEVKSRPARMILVRPDQQFRGGNGSPVFLVTPVSVTTSESDPSVSLHCKAFGNPHPTITWSRNGIQLTTSQRHFIDEDGTLVIRPVKASDHGTYRCDATNSNGRISSEADVIVNVAPVFTVHPQNTETTPGSTIKLECFAVGSPPPEITWFKDDLEVRSDGRLSISPDGSSLQIHNAKETDSGLYICEARNHLGFREVSAKVKVTPLARKPPKFIYKPYNIEALVGSTIELPCKADGDPTPGIQWQKDGASLQRTGRTKVSLIGNLYIYGVVPDDQGRYECAAINDFGRSTASCYVTVKENQNPTDFGIGDKFVKIAFDEASHEVDKAINKTIDNLFHNKGPHSSADLFRLVRFPDAPARELARAAEVYERTLVNIRKHVERGMTMNASSNFNYREILSPDHLNLVAELSGCMTHRLARNCSDMCFHSKYRTIDGTCNNLQHPMWGASLTGFRRILKPIYENGFSTPVGWNKGVKYYGFPKPSSRLVSTTLIATKRTTPDGEITHMVMQWGQFLDHDLDHAIPSVSSESWDGIDCKKSCDYAAPCYPMDVPPNDPRVTNRRCIDFIRSSAICGSGMTSVFFDNIQHREQINQLTSYIDASQVYGFSEELARDLRDLNSDGGRLREGPIFPNRKPLLPYAGNQGVDCRRNLSESTINCFVAGDIRANEQAGLIAMHTLWMREHNRVARELKQLNPQWNSDTVYHESRKIIGAAMQHLTYQHWLRFIIGEEGMQLLGEYKGYDPTVNPSISNVFATAALRFGHTLINPVLHRLDWDFKPIREGHLPLHKAFFSPWRIVDEGGIDPLLRGLFTVPAKIKKPDENLNTALTEQLFETAHAVALDLAAMNIHRSRDHAIPGYIEFRKFCNMTQVDSFEDLTGEITDRSVLRKLQDLYGHPGNIDVWVGGVLEDPVKGGRVGPLFRCLLIEQFRRLRDGDRFYYENPSVFKPEQLVQIKQYSLSRVLCDNGDNITRVSKNAFVLPELQGGFSQCEEIPRVDLSVWSECCSDCRYSGQLNTISRLNARNRRHLDEGFANSTLKDGYFEENRKLKKRIVRMEKDLTSMKDTIQELERVIRKLEREN